MRSFISSLILFSLLLLVVTTNAIYVNNEYKEISELAKEIKSADNRDALVNDMVEKWDRASKLLSLSVRLSEVERMNDLIRSLWSSHKSQNEAELQKCCHLISELADELSGYEQVSFKSIF